MGFIPTIVLLAATLAGGEKEHQGNPLFKELTKEGMDVGAKAKALFPAPTMADGLDAAGQKKVLQKLIEGSYELDDFVRYSVEAPRVLRVRNIEPSDSRAPARGVDFWFVAYGDWNKVSNKDFLERAWNTSSSEGKAKTLTAADLAKRQIVVPADKPNQAYGHGIFPLFGKVEISSTGHSSWSKSADSFLVAGKVDERFDKDAEFPNRWRSMTKDDNGNTTFGPANTFHGAAYYLKMTRLHEPKGAIFIEGHVIFNEPTGWFDGANFLRSKLPFGLQIQARALRREFLKTMTP